MKIIIAILIFGILVLIHELGHFIFARVNGIEVLDFSIGMGPKIKSWVKINGIWACPSETDEQICTSQGYYNTWKGTHYGMNRYMSQKYLSTASSVANQIARKLSRVERPSITFSIGDKWTSRLNPTTACPTEMRARWYQMGQRHSGKWNYATLDGGVKSMGNYPKMGASSDYGDWLYAPVKW